MKKIFNIIILCILVISLIGLASAMSTYEQSVSDKMTNIFSKFKYGLTKGAFLFTTWGQSNGCSVNPDWSGWIRGSMSQPTTLTNSVSCSKVGKTKCAIDIWYDNTIYLGGTGPPANVNWNNWLKEVAGTGVSFSGTTYSYYYVEIYGCPDTVTPPTETHSTTVYKCQLGTWTNKGSYAQSDYCSYDTSGVGKCWCSSATNNFYVSQAGSVGCYSSAPSSWCPTYVAHSYKNCVASGSTSALYWYDSLGARNDLIQSCSSSQTCTLNGCTGTSMTCNALGASCGGPSNLQSGQPCCSGLNCQNFQCVSISPISCISDCSCAATTLVGSTCSDGCGGTCPGGKSSECTTSQISISGVCTEKNVICTADGGTKTCAASCSDGILNGDETAIDCGGTCSACSEIAVETTCGDGICERGEEYNSGSFCSSDCPADPAINGVVISNVRVADADGNKVTSNTTLQPGQILTVKFTVKVPYSEFALRYLSADIYKEYNIETGLIPASVAKSWFGEKEIGTFSINNLFATTIHESQCCGAGQPNILADKTTFSKSIFGLALQAVRDDTTSYATSEHEIQIQVPNKDTDNLCPMSGESYSTANPESYWDPSSEYYVLYIDIKNDCYAKNGVFQGYTSSLDKLYETKLNLNGTGTSVGITCEDNADCTAGETCTPCSDLDNSKCTFWQRIGGTNKCSGGAAGSAGSGLTAIKKFSLTKEQISKSTSGDLLSASCLSSVECMAINSTKDTASCIPISVLREEGTLSESQTKDFWANSKKVVMGGIYGAGAGVTTCVVLASTVGLLGLGPGALLASPAILGGCAAIGGLAGVGVGQVIVATQDDALLKELKAENGNKVGICTSEPKPTTFDVTGLLNKVGKAIKITGNETVDGLIIIIGGILIIMFLFNSAKGSKK